MKAVRIYDKAQCCPTGVCGTQVDPVLPRFAADLDWLKSNGVPTERFDLAHRPDAFVAQPAVQAMLERVGPECLPITTVDDRIVGQGGYPSRAALAAWAGLGDVPQPQPIARPSSGGGCCGGGGCG